MPSQIPSSPTLGAGRGAAHYESAAIIARLSFPKESKDGTGLVTQVPGCAPARDLLLQVRRGPVPTRPLRTVTLRTVTGAESPRARRPGVRTLPQASRRVLSSIATLRRGAREGGSAAG